MPTSLHTNSKADTRFFCDNQSGTIAGLAVDESQYRTDLTNATTYVYEDASERTTIFSGTIELRFTYDGGESGSLLWQGADDLSEWMYWIYVDGSAYLTVSYKNGTVTTGVQLDGGGTGEYIVLVTWYGHKLSLAVWSDNDALWYEGITQTISEYSPDPAVFTIGSQGYGSDDYSYGAETISMVRISSRVHSREECYLDWIGTTTPATPTGTTRMAALPFVSQHSNGYFAGPSVLIGGAAVYHHDRRLIGPLLDVRMDNQDVSSQWQGGGVYGPDEWLRTALKSGGSNYFFNISQLWWRPVPPAITHGRVRVMFAHWKDVMADDLSIFLRMYSLNRLPIINQIAPDPPPPPIESFYVEVEDTQHGTSAGPGIWLDLGILKLARGGNPFGTYFALAVSIDEGNESPTWDAQSWSVKHVAIDAVTIPAGDDEYWGKGPGEEQAP